MKLITQHLRLALLGACGLAAAAAAGTALPLPSSHADQAPRATAIADQGDHASNGKIVFRRYLDADQTKGALFVIDPDGSDVRQVTHPPRGWKDNVPAWGPGGRRITFERTRSDESATRIMLVEPGSRDTRVVVPCTRAGCVAAIDPYFAPGGGALLYSRTVAPPGSSDPPEWKLYSAIFLVRLDGSGSRQVTSTPLRHRGLLATETTDPTVSPDRSQLAFIRTRHTPEDQSAVFVQPLGSPEDARRITPWRMSCQDRPTFSPDGKRLLFRCLPRGEDGPSNLYLARPNGSDLTRLTRPASARQYLGSGFSPTFHDGHGWIVAGRTGGVGEDGNADVFRILVRKGQAVRTVNVTRSQQWDSGAGWGTHPVTP